MLQSVSQRFSNVSDKYEDHAFLQKDVARRLAASLEPWRLTLPAGPVLEVGAGTGFLTREMLALLPERNFIITDISKEMLETCRYQLEKEKSQNIEFRVLDAENFDPGGELNALVTGSFVAQWFRHPAITLSRLAESLEPGGLMLLSFPGHESFPEWRQKTLELGIPYTGNALPDTEELVIKLSMGGDQVDFFEDTWKMKFPDSMSFFRHLKQIGSSSLQKKNMTYNQLKLLTGHWDQSVSGPVTVTWHLVFLALKKVL